MTTLCAKGGHCQGSLRGTARKSEVIAVAGADGRLDARGGINQKVYQEQAGRFVEQWLVHGNGHACCFFSCFR